MTQMSTELIKAAQLPFSEISQLGKVFAASGLFTDVKSEAQAVVRILAGQEIGIPAFAAISGIFIIQGKPTIGAGLMASRVKASGKYDYKVIDHSEKACSIDFYQGKEKIGNSNFTIEDAKKAGTKNLDKFPKNMLFARALSNGVKWFTPDIFAGPVYVPEEMSQVTEDINHVEIFTVSDQDIELADTLIKNSTLDDNKKVQAANSISNAKDQKAVDKIINRLREVQSV
jgi:hypothetical protein